MPYYVIYNRYAGTWIHETLFRIKKFRSRKTAKIYIQEHRLNPRYYMPELRVVK